MDSYFSLKSESAFIWPKMIIPQKYMYLQSAIQSWGNNVLTRSLWHNPWEGSVHPKGGHYFSAQKPSKKLDHWLLPIYLSIRTCIGLHDITITGSTTDEKVESIHPSSQRNRGLTTDKLTHRKKKSKRVSNTKPGLPGLFYIITQRDHLKLWIMSYSTASTKGGFPLLKSPEIRF